MSPKCCSTLITIEEQYVNASVFIFVSLRECGSVTKHRRLTRLLCHPEGKKMKHLYKTMAAFIWPEHNVIFCPRCTLHIRLCLTPGSLEKLDYSSPCCCCCWRCCRSSRSGASAGSSSIPRVVVVLANWLQESAQEAVTIGNATQDAIELRASRDRTNG